MEYVSDVVKEEYKKWKGGDIALLYSQVGTGKTYFVFNVLVPSLKPPEKLLYVCNRRKLNKQVKYDLLKLRGEKLPKNKKEEDALIKREIFGNIHILNYQRLESFLNYGEYDVTSFKYIVMDEAHYFCVDTAFNHKTFLSKKALIDSKLSDTVKVLISATINDLLPYINKKTYNELYSYSTGSDFSYLNPQYFTKSKDIIQLIINDQTDDKWLIFVTSKQSGDYIRRTLEEAEIDAVFTHSKTSTNYIKNEKFDEKVYICTKHLDNGVNITDDKLKHVVVMAYDEVTFIQEVGRCRVDIKNAREVNLYLPTFSKKNFKKKIDYNYNRQIAFVDEFNVNVQAFHAKYKNDHLKVPNTLFVLDELNQWILNVEGINRLHKDKKFAEEMINYFENGYGEYEGKDFFAYIKVQLSWLGLQNTFDLEKLIKNVPSNLEVNQLYITIKALVGKKMFTEEQQVLSNIILNQLVTIETNVDYRTKKLNPKTLESILRDQLKLPFAVSNPKQESKGEMRGKRYIVLSEIN